MDLLMKTIIINGTSPGMACDGKNCRDSNSVAKRNYNLCSWQDSTACAYLYYKRNEIAYRQHLMHFLEYTKNSYLVVKLVR